MQYEGYQVNFLGGFITQPRSKNLGSQVLRQGPVTLNKPLHEPYVATEINHIQHNRYQIDAGYLVSSFFTKFYDRIAIIPASLALGSISSDQIVDIQVWNAFLTTQTLLSVTISGHEGISLTGPSTPLRFNRLAIYPWKIHVSMQGPDEIHSIITWHFAGLDPISFTLTGRRSVPWLIAPDWATGITESLEWKTDVLTSQTGAEQRIARRLSPRRTLEFKIIAGRTERQQVEQAIYAYGSRSWALPIFHDATILPTALAVGTEEIAIVTDGKDFKKGGTALIRASRIANSRVETVEIADVDSGRLLLVRGVQQNWLAGAIVYPLRTAVFTDPPAISRKTDGVITAQIRFQITEHNGYSDSHDLPIYDGFPVLEPGSDWRKDLTANYERMLHEIDNGTGITHITDSAGRAFGVQAHSWTLSNRVEQSKLRRIFYYLRGMQRPIWISSQSSDFYPASDINGTTIDFESNGFSDIGPTAGRRHIRIQQSNGEIHYRRMIASTTLDEGVERIAFDGTGLQIAVNQIMKISFITLSRLNNDTIRWQHQTDADGIALITATFREVRSELE